MRSISKVTLLAGGASTALLAGQWPEHANAQTAPVPGSFDWSGFYAGLNLGGVWSDHDSAHFGMCGPFTNLKDRNGSFWANSADDVGCPQTTVAEGPHTGSVFPTFDLDDDYVAWTGGSKRKHRLRGLFGAHFGINRQAGQFVFGIEGDISHTFGNDGKSTVMFDYFDDRAGPDDLYNYFGSGTVKDNATLDWLATLRGRAGYAFGPGGRFLVFGTGGIAIAGFKGGISGDFKISDYGDQFCSNCTFGDAHNGDDVKLGPTVGVGGEYALTDHLILGVQYLYAHFSSDDHTITFHGNEGRQFDVTLGGGPKNVHVFDARLSWKF